MTGVGACLGRRCRMLLALNISARLFERLLAVGEGKVVGLKGGLDLLEGPHLGAQLADELLFAPYICQQYPHLRCHALTTCHTRRRCEQKAANGTAQG